MSAPVKFGYLFDFREPPGISKLSSAEFYSAMFEQIEYLDRSGFDSIWVKVVTHKKRFEERYSVLSRIRFVGQDRRSDRRDVGNRARYPVRSCRSGRQRSSNIETAG